MVGIVVERRGKNNRLHGISFRRHVIMCQMSLELRCISPIWLCSNWTEVADSITSSVPHYMYRCLLVSFRHGVSAFVLLCFDTLTVYTFRFGLDAALKKIITCYRTCPHNIICITILMRWVLGFSR